MTLFDVNKTYKIEFAVKFRTFPELARFIFVLRFSEGFKVGKISKY